MKVKDLINKMSEWDENEEVCVLVYRKELFDRDEDEDIELTEDNWVKVVACFEENDFDDMFESILDLAEVYYTTKEVK